MTSDHYLNSMIIEALLENGMRDLKEIEIIAQEHLPAIKRVYYECGFDHRAISDSLYDQLFGMITDYFSQILNPSQNTINA